MSAIFDQNSTEIELEQAQLIDCCMLLLYFKRAIAYRSGWAIELQTTLLSTQQVNAEWELRFLD